MDIIFNPPDNQENQYIRLLVDQLRAKGYRIHPLDTIFSSWKHFRSIRRVHLNWFENVDDRGLWVALRSFLRKVFVLTVIHWSGKPLIWTLHNRMSHEKGPAFFSRTLIRLLIRWSDHIVIHNSQSKQVLAPYGTVAVKKTVHIPHPHFIGVYGDVRSEQPTANDPLELLFTGMVKPYKNLEPLIEAVRECGPSVRLTIAGKPSTDGYRRRIAALVQPTDNVVWKPYFVPDEEVAALLAGADVVVLPYDLTSSLNSGTAILAFSYKKTVICPEIGTITDLDEAMQDTFHYRYQTVEQHREALTEQIRRAVHLKHADPAGLAARGERLQARMKAIHDPGRAGAMLDKLYRT